MAFVRTKPRPAGTQKIADRLPGFVQPQLTQLVRQAPDGDEWLHEIKFDGYRMHAQIDCGKVSLLTRTGLNWTAKYPPIAEALAALPVRSAYFDGELCGVRSDGTTSFSIIQAASDTGNAAALVFFLFDCLNLNGEDLARLPLHQRKQRLAELLAGIGPPLQYSDHQVGRGREEFVVVGWTDPRGLARIWARCCWPSTRRTASSSMPGAPVRASTQRSCFVCGAGWSQWAPRRLARAYPSSN